MGLFPQFPYSNLHELNLDWIIEQIRQVTGEGVVLSVNGLSGIVTLYTENNIALPDCHFDTEWSVARLIDEKIAGIKFTGEKFFYITKNHDAEEFTVQEVYTSGNQPPYPVTSVNGHDGAVVLAGDNLPYVIDGSYTIEDIVEAIQGAIGAVIRGKKCDQAVTAGQYVFLIMSNITGRTDGLYKAVNDVPANTDFSTGDLFPATIGLGGKLGEAEDDIDDLDTRLTSVETDTATLKDDLPTVAGSVAFIINGSTCPQAVTTGQYVILIHSTVSGRADGLYKAVNNVSANTPWTSADLRAVTGGLGAEVGVLNSKVTWKKLDGTQTHLNGSDKLTYPVGATEIFIQEGETYTECIQIPITAISSGDSYWYTKSRAFHINKTNRQVWCYAKEDATECYTILYYR